MVVGEDADHHGRFLCSVGFDCIDRFGSHRVFPNRRVPLRVRNLSECRRDERRDRTLCAFDRRPTRSP